MDRKVDSNDNSDFDVERLAHSNLLGQFVYYETLPSTNDLALELGCELAIPLPTLVLTKNQLSGRGRSTNSWNVASGALTFSLIDELPESFDLTLRSSWPLVAGLSVVETLNRFAESHSASIKWPNDVLFDGKKIAGILIEQVNRIPNRYVVGMGINVNNQIDPKQLPNATSLFHLRGVRSSLTEVLLATLSTFLQNSYAWTLEPSKIIARCNQLLAHLEKPVILKTGDQSIEGICLGIDQVGQLLIEEKSGDVKAWSSGTLRFF